MWIASYLTLIITIVYSSHVKKYAVQNVHNSSKYTPPNPREADTF